MWCFCIGAGCGDIGFVFACFFGFSGSLDVDPIFPRKIYCPPVMHISVPLPERLCMCSPSLRRWQSPLCCKGGPPDPPRPKVCPITYFHAGPQEMQTHMAKQCCKGYSFPVGLLIVKLFSFMCLKIRETVETVRQ